MSTETFGSFADVFGGATPKTTEQSYWDGDLAWATPTDVTRLSSPYLLATTRKITADGLRSCAAILHPVGTIFMTSRATIGAFAVNQLPAATNQGFIAVRPRRDADRWFLFEEMRSRVAEFLDNANGSTFQEISRGTFKELPLLVPAPEAIDELDTAISPLHGKAAQLAQESSALEALRDMLLPELLYGRLLGAGPKAG
ncbi:restriction endonuclease subunit S [Terrabacter sp. LjRoot27]|uniref:restriction endonuclease subunit S n=1 Tax=Terrabacter sp. LjRoot27 TaxID=3342306 RepID=UPI003ECE2E54